MFEICFSGILVLSKTAEKVCANLKEEFVMHYFLLAAAIGLELIATTLLKYSEGFTKLAPTAACCVLYVACYLCLAKAVTRTNLGVAYAVWCGVGIVVTALISAYVFKEGLSGAGVIGILLIVAGCIILNLWGTSH